MIKPPRKKRLNPKRQGKAATYRRQAKVAKVMVWGVENGVICFLR
jgi:hypothetical protein